MNQYYSNGKLLLTAEYLVLDEAKALALPTKFGQDLVIKKTNSQKIKWYSFNEKHDTWFKAEYNLNNLKIIKPDLDIQTTKTLQNILKEALKLTKKEGNNNFLIDINGLEISTNLTFPKNWGLGTSSTLINNIAKWANIDAYELLQNSFGGSGYDIACADNNTPILFQLKNKKAHVKPVKFSPSFKDQLYFIHLNKKQNSREGIKKYQTFNGDITAIAAEISELTNNFLTANNILTFENLIIEHEQIISTVIKENPIQKTFFSDYFGQTKSLGAWGGDFILATGNKDTPAYFKNKGFHTIVNYQDMIL